MPSDQNSPPTAELLVQDLHQGPEKRQREVIRTLAKSLQSCSQWSPDTEQSVKILTEFYLNLPSKSSLKPYILSFIDNSDTRITSNVQNLFMDLLKLKLTKFEKSERRYVSDSICRILDSKNMVDIIPRLLDEVLKFLVSCVISARDDSVVTDDSVEFNDAMMDIKVAVHTLNKFLLKMEKNLAADHVESMRVVVETCMAVIKQENALLDCQTSCAMTLPVVYRILYGDTAVETLLEDLFEASKSDFSVRANSMQANLCLLTGLVGGMSSADLLSQYNGHSVLCIATEKVFEAYDGIEEGTKAKYALSRCLVVLTSRMLACAEMEILNFKLMQKRFLQYVYNHVEDPVDGIRHQAKNVFENVINIHVKLHESRDELINLLEDIISMDWHRKGKYGLLSVLSVHIQTSKFLEIRPNLPSLMLTALDEIGMSNYVCELYDKLMLKHKDEVAEETWHEIWLEPVVRSLSDASLRKAVIEYILPKVLQATKSGMKFLIPNLINGRICSDSLLVLITCLKRARCLGYIPQTQNTDKWNDILPVKLLVRALEHSDENLRLEALGLLCSNPKTTEPVPSADLDLIKEFIFDNLTSQSPATRQDIVSAFRKLLIRIKESWTLLLKKQIHEQFAYYVSFIREFYAGLLRSVYPGVSYTRRVSALSLLVSTVKSLSDVPGLPAIDSLVDRAIAENVFQMLTDTFEETKSNALNILMHIDGSKLGLDTVEKLYEILKIGDDLVKTTRPQDCTTAAYIHKVLIQQPLLAQALQSEAQNNVEHRQEILLGRLIVELGRQVEVGEKDLIHASVHAPMYPVLHCIRYLLKDVYVQRLTDFEIWREHLKSVVEICFRACAVVSPVISHASPEGNVPVQDLIGDQGDDVSLSTVQDMPEFLVVCSWRTVKEVALLLGDLSCWPINTELCAGFITVDSIMKIGQFFTDMLLESRHRGAFELAYAGFQPMCTMLWSSKLESLNQLPQTWLDRIMTDIRNSDSADSRLCATRRSAGVPFYVLALVVTEPASRGRQCLAKAMDSLLAMAEEQNTMAQIHALNALRALYKDNRLGESVLGYVSQGMRISVLGFSAETWAVRNASTLLFSTLMVRIFGVRRDKNVISCKNSLSGRIFFYRYPALFPFLLDRIQQCTDSIETLNPGLYPVLMILGRLTPSVLEGTDTAMNVAAFIPSVMRCAASPVLKTRQMGARALCPIVFKDQLEAILTQICQRLEQPSLMTSSNGRSMNLTHGLLLQLIGLLEDSVSRKLVLSTEILRRIYRSSWLMGRRNPCFMTRGAYIQVIQQLLLLIDASLKQKFLNDILVIVHQETAAFTPTMNICHCEFMVNLISLYLQHCREMDNGRLLTFLTGHRLYEVREVVLSFLIDNPGLRPGNLEKRLEKESHPNCLALLLRLLSSGGSVHPVIRDLKPLQYDVMCARLQYIAGNGNDDERLHLFNDLKRFSQPESVLELRLAAAQALQQLSQLLMDRNPCQSQMWSVCITLLLDDDDDVRARASDVIAGLSNDKSGDVKMSSVVALKRAVDKPGDVKLSSVVALKRAVDLIFSRLPLGEWIHLLVDLLCGEEKVDDCPERLFDKGEQSTFEDRIHLILLLVDKFDECNRSGDFIGCEKLISNLFKSVSSDFNNSLQRIDASLQQRFVATSVFTERFCQDFGLFCALFVLDKIRTGLKMADFEPSFKQLKDTYLERFPVCVWPVSRFCSMN